MMIVYIALFGFLLISIASAESPTLIDAPVLKNQISPVYPAEALDNNSHEDVSVLVTVGVDGLPKKLEYESGSELFRASALDAAAKLRFEPATHNGAPVVATTRVYFHFTPPALNNSSMGSGIVVHSESPDAEELHSRTTLSEQAIDAEAGNDLSQILNILPGVQKAGSSTSSSKSLIRGHTERRLLILNDGIRHESQKWGPDHALEIDPFSAGEISVIRGAPGARYGPDAMGGVILVIPPKMRSHAGVGGKLLTAYSSNGLSPYGAFRLDSVPQKYQALSLRVEGNLNQSSSLMTPNYVLGNTGSKTWNLGGRVRWKQGSFELQGSWNHHDYKAGIFYGMRHPSPAELQAQLEREVPVNAEQWKVETTIDRPFQNVHHDTGALQLRWDESWGELEIKYAFQRNYRREYDTIRGDYDGAQYNFTLRTHSLDTLWQHPGLQFGIVESEGGLGVQSSFKENVYSGYSLIPNYRSFDGGLFVYERFIFPHGDLQLGLRADGLMRDSYLQERDYEKHLRRDSLALEGCTYTDSVARCRQQYPLFSASGGGLLHLIPDRLDLKGELSLAGRFPNVDELYLIGAAPTMPVFALSNPQLEPEQSFGGSLTSALQLSWINTEISGYWNRIDDYIYFAPELNDAGEPVIDVIITGAYPRYSTRAIDAEFRGLDGRMIFGEDALFGLDISGSIVRASERSSGDELVGTPPDTLRVTLQSIPPEFAMFTDSKAAVTVRGIGKQSRVVPSQDIAPAPEGAWLLDAELGTSIQLKSPLQVSLRATNLLNQRYREYTSLMRYSADQPGRDIRISIGTQI